MDPVTLALIAGSTLVKTIGGLFGASSKAKAYKAQARADEAAAIQVNEEASINAQAGMTEAARAEAAGFNAAAGSGGFTGSAVDVLNDFAGTSLFNARAAVYRGQTEAANLKNRGAANRINARNANTEGLFSAAGSILGGFSDYRAARAPSGGK